MARIYYVGDWAVLTGPVFAETPFYYSHEGLDVYNYGHAAPARGGWDLVR